MSSGLLQIGVTGLAAAQYGLSTTSHNIANQATPGYTRQSNVQSAVYPHGTAFGFWGQGVQIDTVRRSYDQFLTQELLSTQTKLASLDTYQAEISKLDNLLSNVNNQSTNGQSVDVSGAMTVFFASINALAANPSDVSVRQAFISQGQSLVARFKLVDSQIDQFSQDVNGQISDEINKINDFAKQITDINYKIFVAQGQGGGQPPNDLLDQRDNLVSQLNKEIGAVGIVQSDGSFNVYIGTGQALVVGQTAIQLTAAKSPTDPGSIVVNLGANSISQIPDSQLTGGKLGGLLAYRDETLYPARNALGRLAVGLADTLNNQLRKGQDLNAAAGVNFFKAPDPTVAPSSRNANTGPNFNFSAKIISSDYRVDVDAAGKYTITRLSDGTHWDNLGAPGAGTDTVLATDNTGAPTSSTGVAGVPVETGFIVDGVHIPVSGAATGGKTYSFTVQPGNAAGSRVIADSSNPDSAVKLDSSASSVEVLEGSDYKLEYTADKTFRLTRLSDGANWTATGTTNQEALNRLAAQHQTGFVLTLPANGPTVGDSFQISPTRTAASNLDIAYQDTNLVAAGTTFSTAKTLTNRGSGAISTGVMMDPTLQGGPGFFPVTLTYDATTKKFAVTGGGVAAGATVDYDPVKAPVTITVKGMQFTISGIPQTNDSFTLNRATNTATDGRNAASLAALQAQNTMLSASGTTATGGATTFAGAYAALVATVGNKANAINTADTAQTALVQSAQTARDSVSAVNMDEEAANLVKFQQAYQACAKCIGVAGTIFDSLLQALNA